MRYFGGHRTAVGLLVVGLFLMAHHPPVQGQARLEAALADLYAICLFEPVGNNPFSQAAGFARDVFAPGINGFLESSLAAIPLTPPNLDVEYVDGELVNVVTGFTPIYTESSATVGRGMFLVGANASYFNLSEVRGQRLDALSFGFEQDGGGDRIMVDMPFNLEAYTTVLFGTFGVTNRFDVGVALPVVRLGIDNISTTFRVEGNNTNCRYAPPDQGGLNCSGRGNREVSPPLDGFVDVSGTETFLGSLALRAKYRFALAQPNTRLAAVADVRLPTRSSDSALGSGDLSARFLLIGEYGGMATFKPYVNMGAQFWNGANTNRLNLGGGFNQQITSRVFFAFDLLGQVQLEADPFLTSLNDAIAASPEGTGVPLVSSSIPSSAYDHTLNAGLGLQVALAPGLQVYGSGLFSLIDQGLQSGVVPSIGGAFYF